MLNVSTNNSSTAVQFDIALLFINFVTPLQKYGFTFN
jgi:hypothetical protein